MDDIDANEARIRSDLERAVAECLSVPEWLLDQVVDAARSVIDKAVEDYFDSGVEVVALPITDEDRANRVFRLGLRQRQIMLNIDVSE
jgi:hypothetical protein